MTTRRSRPLRVLIIATAALLIAPLLSVVMATGTAAPAQAANSALFNPGYIISDALFYDGGTMNAAQVQSFLASKEPGSCTGGQMTCLKNYSQATPTIPADSLCPGAYAGSSSDRAADIIAKAGAACGISQRVLLVTLQKEQSLVTATQPSSYAYLHATGFGCPDSSPYCDPNFYGFFFQVYYAAHQFQNYAHHPASFNYIAGRTNFILYSPVCTGRASVFIQNKATAGLYDYTPYVPNGPSGCVSNGNLNFWNLFTDWFGPTTAGTSLLRTIDNGTVYLVSSDTKYPIPSLQALNALSPLGPVGYVSQSYLDSLTTGHLVGHALRDPNGTIYFYDSGIKLPFTTCAQMQDYGATYCDASGYVQLSQTQIDMFYTGPTLSSIMGTTEGARYYIHGGLRSEILDDQSQTAAGISGAMNVLTENAVSYLPLSTPVVRDAVYASARGAGTTDLLSGGKAYTVAAGDDSAFGASSRAVGGLWPASLALLPAGGAFTGLVSANGTTSLLTSTGRVALSGGAVPPTANSAPVPVASDFLQSYPDQGTLSPGSFFKSPTNGSVYVVMPADVRPVSSWGALLALTPPGASPKISIVSQAYVGSLVFGPTALTAGSLVRSPQDATVYYINGVTNRIALSTFVYTQAAGISGLSYVDQSLIDAYPMSPQLMGFGFACGSDNYVAAGGRIHPVPAALASLYPLSYLPLDAYSCQQLVKGPPMTAFIRTPDGSIYQLSGGQKLPIATMTRFAQLSGGTGYTDVAPQLADLYPTGPLA